MDIKEFLMQYGEMISTICAMVTLCYVIMNSSKHDKNIEKAFNTFMDYWSSLDSQQKDNYRQREELFHQSIKPRFDVENRCSMGYLDSGDIKIKLTFRNKGLGNACNTYVECLDFKGNILDDNTVFTRIDPAEKNAIGVGETINFCFSCKKRDFSECINVIVTVIFEDLADQKYRQTFDLFVYIKGNVQSHYFPDVEMVTGTSG